VVENRATLDIDPVVAAADYERFVAPDLAKLTQALRPLDRTAAAAIPHQTPLC